MKTSRNITVSAIAVLILAMAFVPITSAESQVAPYRPNVTGNGEWGDVSGEWLSTITHFNAYRIRSSDDITRAEVWARELDWFDEFYIEVWRENTTTPGTFDKITETENLRSKFHDDGGVNTITFDTPLTGINEGDIYGMVVHRTVTGFSPFKRFAEPSMGDGYYATYFNTGNDAMTHQQVGRKAYDWRSRSHSDNAQPIALFTAKNTDFIFVGDSITEGYNEQRAYWTDEWKSAYGYAPNAKFEILSGMSTQNMANYSAETDDIMARWDKVLDLNPVNVVLAAGVNDVRHNPGVSEQDCIDNQIYMINSATAAGIQVYYVDTFGYGEANNPSTIDAARHQEIDRINTAVAAHAVSVGAYVVNTDSRIAEYNPLGDPGNMWSLQQAYWYSVSPDDSLHLSESGNVEYAAAVYEVYLAHQPVSGTFDDAYDGLNGVTNDAWAMLGILPIVLIAGIVLTIVMVVFAGGSVDPRIVIAAIPIIIMAISTMYIGLMIIDKLPK